MSQQSELDTCIFSKNISYVKKQQTNKETTKF